MALQADVSGPAIDGTFHTPSGTEGEEVSPAPQYVWVVVSTVGPGVLPSTLFNAVVCKGVIHGTTGHAPERVQVQTEEGIMVMFPAEVDLDQIKADLEAKTYWLGHPVTIECRDPTPNQLEIFREASRVEGPPETSRGPESQEGERYRSHGAHARRPRTPSPGERRMERMLEDIHQLAQHPSSETLKIPNFSGELPPGKGEVSYSQWIFEVRDAMSMHSEQTVKSWVLRSLRGQAASDVRHLGPRASVARIVEKLEDMYGTVAPYAVMMKSFFGVQQGKGEKVSAYVTRLEGILAEIRTEHPMRMTEAEARQSLEDVFFRGMKKTLKDSLRYLFDTPGITFRELLRAARRAEAEAEGFHEEGAVSKAAHPEESKAPTANISKELGELTAEIRKLGMSKQNQNGGYYFKPKIKRSRETDPCHKCGELGHWKRECPQGQALNGDRGGTSGQLPPQQPQIQARQPNHQGAQGQQGRASQ